MSATRITSPFTRTFSTRFRNSSIVVEAHHDGRCISTLSPQLPSPARFSDKVITSQLGLKHRSAPYLSSIQWFGFSSSASPQPNAKANSHSGNEHESEANNPAASAVDSPDKTGASTSTVDTESGSVTEPVSNASGAARRRGGSKRIAFSDSESDSDELSRDDLVNLVAEKERLLGINQEELELMKDEVMRTLAEMENVKYRSRLESEDSKKFVFQNFAKSLLDVADDLGGASSAAKESFSKIDEPEGAGGAFQQLKVLLQGVKMTEKQLLEVFRKFGLERYDPLNEEFDPNRHNAIFQVPDASKPADRVAVVLKAGYILHDRVIRPAEVGVTVADNTIRKLKNVFG